jgi:hypothetical protein
VQNFSATLSQDPSRHIYAMVEETIPCKVQQASSGPAAGVTRSENQAPHPGVKHRPDTHRAGLKRYVYNGFRQSVVADPDGGAPDCQDFGMRRRVI